MLEPRGNLALKYSSAKSLLIWHFLNKRLNSVLVSEFPKSGGTWFCQMLSKTLEIPFPRNETPKFQEAIMHSHFSYHKNFNDVIYILRDGRDIMVSAFYYFLAIHPNNNNTRAIRYRKELGFDNLEDIKSKLPKFIEYFMEKYTVLGQKMTWQKHVNHHLNNDNIHTVKYEDLLDDAATQLEQSLHFLNRKSKHCLNEIAQEFTFENQSKRKAGEEVQTEFLRKGIAGDWKNKFTRESAIIFDQYAGETLIAVGYEKNKSWIDQL